MNKTYKKIVCPHCGKDLQVLSETSPLLVESLEFYNQLIQGKSKEEFTDEAKKQYEQILSLIDRTNNLQK